MAGFVAFGDELVHLGLANRALTRVEEINFEGIDVNTHHAVAHASKACGHYRADVAQPENADRDGRSGGALVFPGRHTGFTSTAPGQDGAGIGTFSGSFAVTLRAA